MSIRKEQILCLVCVLIVAWLGMTFEVGRKPKKLRPRAGSSVKIVARDSILADPRLAPAIPKELFLEPSETRPLEPKGDQLHFMFQ